MLSITQLKKIEKEIEDASKKVGPVWDSVMLPNNLKAKVEGNLVKYLNSPELKYTMFIRLFSMLEGLEESELNVVALSRHVCGQDGILRDLYVQSFVSAPKALLEELAYVLDKVGIFGESDAKNLSVTEPGSHRLTKRTDKLGRQVFTGTSRRYIVEKTPWADSNNRSEFSEIYSSDKRSPIKFVYPDKNVLVVAK